MNAKALGILAVVILFLCLIGYQIRLGVAECEGNFIYPLDDPYIHLMLAKNLAENGTWGFNPGEFASSSSSLLYTLILASVAFLFGSNELTPLIINIITGVALLLSMYKVLSLLKIDFWVAMVMLIGVIFLVPLLSMVISGMEHTLQLLINVIYFYCLLNYLSQDTYRFNRGFLMLCVMSTLTVLIRFEGLFFVPIPFIYLLLSRHYCKALIIVGASVLPVVIFGLISLSQGAYFLPNSLIIKGQRPEHLDMIGLIEYSVVWISNLYFTKHLLGPFILLLGIFIILNVKNRLYESKVYIAVGSTLLYCVAHLQFAKIGWFFRYESYLIVFIFIAFALIDVELIQKTFHKKVYRMGYFLIAFVLCTPLFSRGYESFVITPTGMRNVYEQQYQMAKFIHEYYRTSPIGANDVGAITYLNDIELVDLYGLGSTEILQMKVEGNHTKEAIDEIVKRKGVKVVIIYDGWFDQRIPESWVKVSEWKISDNYVCTYDFVSFYATDPIEVNRLKMNIIDYKERMLPDRVKVRIR